MADRARVRFLGTAPSPSFSAVHPRAAWVPPVPVRLGPMSSDTQPPARDSVQVGIWGPAIAAILLGLLTLTARVQSNDTLLTSFYVAAALLFLGQAAVLVRGHTTGTRPGIDVVLRSQHYIQAAVQVAVLTYWGWHWRPVYDMSLLIAAQLTFAYGFGIVLTWLRGRRYSLGFGPFPIILSINLFLWFKDDWFYLQFLMIAVGFLGKEFVQWTRDGRRVHIFNPSAFALGLFSLALIATGTTDLTWGQEIASTLTLAPHIYTFLFVMGLVVMYFFSITLVAGTAAAVLFGLSAAYSAWAGVPYFVDSEIPAAVFLGLHLLITDPSTSPRTPLGKTAFGALYGVGVFALYTVLASAGAPTFYDKLLCVPLLNLSVRGIDMAVRSIDGRGIRIAGLVGFGGDPARLRKLNLAHIGIWIAFFGVMAMSGKADGTHPGDQLPFWQTACADGKPNACHRLLQIEASYCGDNSAWACNELGVHYSNEGMAATDAELGRNYFSRACELRFQPGCLNLLEPVEKFTASPRPLDLRLLLREGGQNLMEVSDGDLYLKACSHGWTFACNATSGAP